jgi:excisionase family DNA binding protein
MTVREAAAYATVSESLIYSWCADGSLRHTRVGRKGRRGHIRISREDLDAALAAFTVSAPAPATQPVPRPPAPPLKHIRLS